MNLQIICKKIGMELLKVGDVRECEDTHYEIISKCKPLNEFKIEWENGEVESFRPDVLWFDRLIRRLS